MTTGIDLLALSSILFLRRLRIKARFSGINAKAIWFRPDPATPGSATAYTNVRSGIDAFDTANADVTAINTDSHTLISDGVHYSADAYGLHAASVISA
jgi:hypothetical protein